MDSAEPNNKEETKISQEMEKEITQEEENFEVLPQVPLTEAEMVTLSNQAKKFQELFDTFAANYDNDVNTEHYFLLSVRWLRRWKVFVSFDEVNSGRQPTRFMGGPKLGDLNQDLIDEKSFNLIKYPKTHDLYNIFLKEGLQENRDFIIVNSDIMAFFSEIFSKNKSVNVKYIQRPVYQLNDEKKIEVYFRRFSFLYVDNDHLYELDPICNRRKTIMESKMQISSYIPIKELYRLMEISFRQFLKSVSSSGQILRLWKLNNQVTIEQFNKYVVQILRKTSTRDYKIEFNGSYVDRESQKIFDELHNLPEDVFIFEIKAYRSGWTFQNEQMPLEQRCDSCSQYQILKFKCVCLQVSYCTQSCRNKDQYWHSSRCEKAGEEDEQALSEMIEQENSRKGVVGLKNLGNTCFMNSALQCLTQTRELVQYFLAKQYVTDMNVTNPIGSGGQVAKAFAHLIIRMFYDESSELTPHQFKRAIGGFQNMFSGYSQHDSHQLNGFVLDGIHEDLNRILQQPIVNNQDSNGRDDYVVAKQFWGNFKKRNDSIIVQTMYGQCKSKLVCPDCQKVSISFDPFLALSLPIPQQRTKKMTVLIQSRTPAMIVQEYNISYMKGKGHKIIDVKKEIAEHLKTTPENLMIQLVSNFYYEPDPLDEYDTNTVRKQCKYRQKNRKITCRQLFDWQTSIPTQFRLNITFRISGCYSTYYQTSDYRREITLIRGYVIDKRWTLKEVQLRFFAHFKPYFTQFLDKEKSDEDNYFSLNINKQNKDKLLWKFFVVSNSKASWYTSCYFCGEKRCGACQLEYSDTITVEDLFQKIPEQSDYIPEFEIFVKKINGEMDTDKMFDKELQEFVPKQEKIETQGSGDKSLIEEESKEIKQIEIKSVPDPEQGKDISIYDCFELNRESEQLEKENAWYCSNCKDHKEALQTLEVYKAPQILIIHLKRFKGRTSYYRQKQSALIDFPLQGLDLSGYVLNHELPTQYEKEPQQEQESMNPEPQQLLYDLYGVSNHFGSLGGGHYTAYIKNFKTGLWYNHDDSSVREQRSEKIVSEAAYMLFYRRRD